MEHRNAIAKTCFINKLSIKMLCNKLSLIALYNNVLQINKDNQVISKISKASMKVHYSYLKLYIFR